MSKSYVQPTKTSRINVVTYPAFDNAYLYQEDKPTECNLWGGLLSIQNGYGPEHLQKAVKLMLSAEDLLEALEGLLNGKPATDPKGWGKLKRKAMAAINKAKV